MTGFQLMLDMLCHSLGSLPGAWPMTGGIVTITRHDRVLAIAPFGSTGDANQPAFDEQDLFQVGSISKVFTGIMVLSLVQAGDCDLDAQITRYLPWLVLNTTLVPTVRQLLQHTAGLVKGLDDPPGEHAQCWLLRDARMTVPSGSVFHYSNIGYVLLGLMIEAISGEPAAEFCRRTVLEPLGMHRTVARIRTCDRLRFVRGCVPAIDDEPWVPGRPLAQAQWLEAEAADGNIGSCAADMGRFVRMLLGRGMLEGRQAIPAAAFERLVGELAAGGESATEGFGASPIENSRYGLGINTETIDGMSCLTHGGGMIGYSSFLLADLGHDLGVVVLTNANGDCPVGQILARHVHGLLTSASPAIHPLDRRLRPSDPNFRPAMLGTFIGEDDSGAVHRLTFTHEDGVIVVSSGGQSGIIYSDRNREFVCSLAAFRRFRLSFDDCPSRGRWIHGAMIMDADVAARVPRATVPVAAGLARHVGRYRAHSPWFATFRIVAREAKLFMISAGGVEAPDRDVMLSEREDGSFAMGENSTQPETVTPGPCIGGRTIMIAIDNVRYARLSDD